MKKTSFFIVAAVVAFTLAGCEPEASEDELKLMCQNLVKVRGQANVPTVEALEKEVQAEFKTKEDKLLAWKERDMKGCDTDTEEALDADSEPITPEKVKADFAKKKAIGAKQFDDDLLKLTVEKKERIAGLGDIVAAAQADFEKITEECIAEAKKEKISQSLAACRISAPDKDTYWNKCK